MLNLPSLLSLYNRKEWVHQGGLEGRKEKVEEGAINATVAFVFQCELHRDEK